MGFSLRGCWHWGPFFFATPKNLPCSACQFWQPNSDAIPQLFFREIILAEQVEVPPARILA